MDLGGLKETDSDLQRRVGISDQLKHLLEEQRKVGVSDQIKRLLEEERKFVADAACYSQIDFRFPLEKMIQRAAVPQLEHFGLPPNTFSAIKQTVEEATAGVRALHGSIAALVGSAQSIMDSLTEVTRMAMDSYVPVVSALQSLVNTSVVQPSRALQSALALLPKIELSHLQLAFDQVKADFWQQEWSEQERRAFVLFAKRGFAGLEEYLTMRETDHILELRKKKGCKAVDGYVFLKFKTNRFALLNRMVRQWWKLPYMEKRKKQVRAAIKAHKRGEYELAIPALLPLIDGLAAEIVSGLPGLRRKTIYAKEAMEHYRTIEPEVWSECVEQIVNSLIYEYYDFHCSKKPPSSVNRHGILHGRTVHYASELNSYRVVLLLNVMVRVAQQKGTPRSGIGKGGASTP